MLQKIELEHILFLDIETVPEKASFQELDEAKKELWDQKSRYQRKEDYTPEEFYDRAGIWAEFGKIVCISVGYFKCYGDTRNLRITTFFGEEKKLLQDFKNLLDSYFSHPKYLLCAHNGKEFDFPYIARRMIIQGLDLPFKLNLFGKKPWEIPHLDTMELWKFGDYKHYTSLKLMANILGIPSPKEDIDGSMVKDVFYLEKDIDRIIRYCELDVVTTVQVFLRLRNESLLEADEIKKV
ncbi:3'-5' exonuclease [Spongiimicrobium salis]|uniref:3'-5' exonuclease n=1 Tax=Spongiimicrobium salis TaxID=1667022 RepID=UPI00374D3900